MAIDETRSTLSDPKRVLVLMTTYQRPEFLPIAIRGVLAQTYTDFELLVWNDGGTDMRELVPELNDPRVRYHHHPDNLNVVQAVATALRSTTSEYVAQIDDDDEWEPGFLEALVGALDEHPSASIAFCDHWSMRSDGSLDEVSTDANGQQWGRLGLRAGLHEPAYDLTFNGTIATASAAVIRRSAIDADDFPADLSYAQDLWIAYLATRHGQGAVYEPRRLSKKRRHAGQVGGSLASIRNLQDLTIIYERMLGAPPFRVDRDRLTDRLAAAWANLAVALARTGDTADARRAANRSINVRPTPRGVVARVVVGLPGARAATEVASSAVARWRRTLQSSRLGGRA